MTYQNVIEEIKKLIKARAAAHGDDKQQASINVQLNKLYELKRAILIRRWNYQ